MKFRSLLDVATDICIVNLNDGNLSKRGAVIRTIRIVMDEMAFHLNTPVKSGFFEIKDGFKVNLPDDTIMVTKVGTMCGEHLKLFGRDERVFRAEHDPLCTCYSEAPGTTESCTICTFHNLQFGNRFGEAYAYKRDPWANGMYRYDEATNIIYFSSGQDVVVGEKVLVEYKVSNDETLNMIPAEMVSYLGHKVAAKLNISTSMGEYKANTIEAARSYSSLVAKWNNFSPEDLIAALTGESMGSPKT